MDRSRQIRSHAGLRGVAAMLVVAYHLQFGGTYHLALEDASNLFRKSYIFVDLFFVLSGFILSYINDAERNDILSSCQYKRFMLRRLIRLYPLLFCTLVFMLLERLLYSGLLRSTGHYERLDWSSGSLLVLASQFLLINAWTTGPVGWNVPTWSISAEMAAYLLFPILVAALIRRRLLAMTTLAVFALGFYGWVLVDKRSLDIVGGLAPLRCLAGFSLGMLLYRGRRHISRIPPAALSVVQIGCVIGAIIVPATDLADPLALLFFAGLVITTWTDSGLVARLLGGRIPSYLGEISYSIYLTHVCLIEVLDIFWRGPEIEEAIGSDPARIVFIAACYGTVLFVSHWTFTLVEIPARRRLGRRLLHRRMGPIESSPPAP